MRASTSSIIGSSSTTATVFFTPSGLSSACGGLGCDGSLADVNGLVVSGMSGISIGSRRGGAVVGLRVGGGVSTDTVAASFLLSTGRGGAGGKST